jgi:uncharacterized protein YqgC (DUF456 family)
LTSRANAAAPPTSSVGGAVAASPASPLSRPRLGLDRGAGWAGAPSGSGGAAAADSGAVRGQESEGAATAGRAEIGPRGGGESGTAGDETESGPPDRGHEHWLKRLGRTALSVVGRTVLYLILLIGLVLIPLGLGGTFVMVAAAAVFGLLTGFEQITVRLLAVLLGLALVGEGIESLLGVAMARRYGASKWGMWGAFLGGIAGAIVGAPVPVVGNVVGALIGVFAGAFVLEWIGQGRSDSSLKAGWGALLGRTAAGAIKIALGMVIMILIISRTLS